MVIITHFYASHDCNLPIKKRLIMIRRFFIFKRRGLYTTAAGLRLHVLHHAAHTAHAAHIRHSWFVFRDLSDHAFSSQH